MLSQPVFHFDINAATVPGPYGRRIDAHEVLSGDGAYLMHMKLRSATRTSITILPKQPFILLHFSVQASRLYAFPDSKLKRVAISELQFQLFYVNEQPFRFTVDTGVNEVFEISVTVDYFNALLPHNHVLRSTLSRVEREGTSPLYANPASICPRAKAALYELLYRKLTPASNPIYIRGKILEILALQHAKNEQQSKPAQEPLSHEERQRMYLVKSIVSDRLGNPPSIKELSRLAGTNECYLKNNFKAVFGTTIYGYIKQAKMERAYKLLTTENKKVSEVARLIGYRHASHFTVAFKQQFGYTPSQIKPTTSP